MKTVALPLFGLGRFLVDGSYGLKSDGGVLMAVTARLLAFQAHVGTFDFGACRSWKSVRAIHPGYHAVLTFDMSLPTTLTAVPVSHVSAEYKWLQKECIESGYGDTYQPSPGRISSTVHQNLDKNEMLETRYPKKRNCSEDHFYALNV
jgi:hypothetical protein